MSSESLHENPETLGAEVIDTHRAIVSLMEELEAVDWYNQRAKATSDPTLRAGEFELLKLFAENPNRPLSRDWLLETTSHREMDVFDRAIDIRILRLRRKIEVDPARPTSIRTVRGAGYMFVPPDD